MPNPHLPAELLDHIVDFLHDTEDALRSCCLASKSWIPRVRMHLFADIRFNATWLESWKAIFPDPSTSPAYYAKTLFINCPQVVAAADAEAGGWIRGFSRVMHLEVVDDQKTQQGTFPSESAISLLPFYGFSPVVKSLRVTIGIRIPPSQIFNLVPSFPILEDLTVITGQYQVLTNDPDGLPATVHHSAPPMTGSLTLLHREGLKLLAPRLLALPGGIRFQKLTLKLLRKEDPSLATALVEACSHTLKYLDISCEHLGMSIRYRIYANNSLFF